jgi:DNA-binding NarL/FixJ family response regulator
VIRILLADDQALIRSGIRALLEAEDDMEVAADGRQDSVRVVILTNFGRDEYIFAALRAGASGFLLKDTQPAELLQALRVVMRRRGGPGPPPESVNAMDQRPEPVPLHRDGLVDLDGTAAG